MLKNHPHAHILLAYLRVFALAVAAFVVCTTEFIPIAMLTDIGHGFNMSASDTGIMITVYAWVVSLASLPLMLLVANAERRRLLCWLCLRCLWRGMCCRRWRGVFPCCWLRGC